MKIKNLLLLALAIGIFACEPKATDNSTTEVQPQKMKMTTPTPEGISTANKMNSNALGELNFFDGVPLPETAEKVYDYMDLHNAVDAYVKGIHIASMEGLKRGITEFGPANQTALLFENLMDSKAFW